MKTFLFACSMVFLVVLTPSAQIQDYLGYSWGDSIEEVVDLTKLFGDELVDSNSNYITFHSINAYGDYVWRTFFFDEGLVSIWIEQTTSWLAGAEPNLYTTELLPHSLANVARLAGDGFNLVRSTPSSRFWSKDRSIAGAFYDIDPGQRYRVFRFITDRQSPDLSNLMPMIAMFGRSFPWNEIPEID